MAADINLIQKELDDFVSYVLDYAKKHDLSYIIGVGKRVDEKNCAVMDSWWQPNQGHVETIAKCLSMGEGAIPSCVRGGLLENAADILECLVSTSH
jgi:hypothetical protein